MAMFAALGLATMLASGTTQVEMAELRRQLVVGQMVQTAIDLRVAAAEGLATALARVHAARIDPAEEAALSGLCARYAGELERWQRQALDATATTWDRAMHHPSYREAYAALLGLQALPLAADEGELLQIEAELLQRAARLRLRLDLKVQALTEAANAARDVAVRQGENHVTYGAAILEAWRPVLAHLGTLGALEAMVGYLKASRHMGPHQATASLRRALEARVAQLALAESAEILALPDSYARLQAFADDTHAHLRALRPPWHSLLNEARAPRTALRRCRAWRASLQRVATELAARCPHQELLAELNDALSDEIAQADSCEAESLDEIERYGDSLARLRLRVARKQLGSLASTAASCGALAAAVEADGGRNEAKFLRMQASCR